MFAFGCNTFSFDHFAIKKNGGSLIVFLTQRAHIMMYDINMVCKLNNEVI